MYEVNVTQTFWYYFLFALKLFQIYSNYCTYSGWKTYLTNVELIPTWESRIVFRDAAS